MHIIRKQNDDGDEIEKKRKRNETESPPNWLVFIVQFNAENPRKLAEKVCPENSQGFSVPISKI